MPTDREIVIEIFNAALKSVDPYEAVLNRTGDIAEMYRAGRYEKLYVLSFGKAAFTMARAVIDSIGELVTGGIVITKYGHAGNLGGNTVRVFEAGHPIPDENGYRATREALEFLNQSDERTFVLCLISGGGSSLFMAPYSGISLQDKQKITNLLLTGGADIHEMNTVRKHISLVKGGRLATIAYPSRVESLILSDVLGDRLDVIASGPLVPDETTFGDVLNVIEKYRLGHDLPTSVLDIIRSGVKGLIPETPKPDDAVFQMVSSSIVGNNTKAVLAAKDKAIQLGYEPLTQALSELAYELKQKSVEFSDVIKMGRTQLQDAVPMTLGQEFEGFRVTIKEDIQRIHDAVKLFREINLGATAIGTGITSKPEYSSLATEELCRISGVELVPAANLVEATSDMGAFVLFSGVLKRVAVKISKICNDLRLLSSGPRTGLNEINLPPMAPGSSIMPGKVNPVIPEVMNQVAYQVIGNDLAVTIAAEAGQLQLNVFEPLIAFNIFQSVKMLTQGINTLTLRCIKGITANREHCRNLVEHSIGLVTALNPYIGYKNSTRIAKKALDENRSVTELVLEEGLLSREQLDDILKPERMTAPRS
jgi:aspartate ammonia-lyase